MRKYNTYTIQLPHFEGPFDLLLFFIQRDELDITNIPIAKITDDFLLYIRQMEELDIDLASEFIVVAATLLKIKAKTLLPRKELTPDGEEIDPRDEIIAKLIAYKRFKDVIPELQQRREIRAQLHERGNRSSEWKVRAEKALIESELESFDLYKLLKVYHRLLDKVADRKKSEHKVYRFSHNVDDQKSWIKSMVKNKAKCTCEDLFEGVKTRIHAIVNFLALLELINQQEITIIQRKGVNNFWFKPV